MAISINGINNVFNPPILTTLQYPSLPLAESLNSQIDSITSVYIPFALDAFEGTGAWITSGTLTIPRPPTTLPTTVPLDAFEGTGAWITSGVLRSPIVGYQGSQIDAINAEPATVVSASMPVVLKYYNNYPVDALDSTGPRISGGSLT